MRKLVLVVIVLITNFLFLISLASSVFAQAYSDTSYEYETNCWRIETNVCTNNSGEDCNDVYSYRPSAGNTNSAQTPRADAGFNFSQAVRGFACGEVQSEPIKLKEGVGYDGPPWNVCSVKAGWTGEITFNYGNNDNFWVPFAQELANEWAGTLDTEHMSVKDYDSLVARANKKPDNQVDVQDKISAQNEINQRNGVLRKLLTMDQQDELKCNFANWVAKRHNQGKPSLYISPDYYKPDGQVMLPMLGGPACRNQVCPVGMKNRGTCLENYDNGKTKIYDPNHGGWYAPGPAWQKMGLIPNEKSEGMIKFFVCGDREYHQVTYYPEVFRLGLASNELFKIFTDKSIQDNFYQGENADLKDNPLVPLLTKAILAGPTPAPSAPFLTEESGVRSFAPPVLDDNAKTAILNKTVQSAAKKANDKNERIQPLLQKISVLIKLSWPKVQKAFAQAIEKTAAKTVKISQKINSGRRGVLLAQTGTTSCSGSDAMFQVNVNIVSGSDYSVSITRTDCGKQLLPGLLGHMRLYQDVSGPSGTPHDFYLPEVTCNKNGDRPGCETATFTPQMIPLVLPKFNSVEELKAWLNRRTLMIRNDPWEIPPTAITGNGPTLLYRNAVAAGVFIGGNRCHLDNACCVTFSGCTDTCTTCNRTQFGPSETSVYSWQYPRGHMFVGTDGWYINSEDHIDSVVYSFKPSEKDCKFTPIQDADGLYTNCSNSASYGEGLSCSEGVLGRWDCNRSQERIVNVFNNVPFLGSVWKQTADPQFGFMSAIKPLGIEGTGNIPSDYVGCSDDQNIIFDAYGNYLPQHAASFMQWGFRLMPESYDKVILPPANSLEVTLDQDPAKKSKVLFYRLAGTCNANKWWTEKVLNPMLQGGLTTQGASSNALRVCAQNGVTINPDNYYDINDNCKNYGGEPACCSRMGSGQYAHECDWTERRRCTPSSCALIPEGQSKESCGQLMEVGWLKKGSQILQGK